MGGLSAVIFVPDDTAKTGLPKPLMLQQVCEAPVLAWLSDTMYENGIGRFFLVCHDRYSEEARACLPAEAEVMTTSNADPADLLHVFLSTAAEGEDEITVVAGPSVYAPSMARRSGSAISSSVCRASRLELMTVLDENFSFSQFLRENCSVLSDFDGYFRIDSPATLLELANLIRFERILSFLKQGVQITDPNNCYIGLQARIEPNARILPGAVIRGKCVIRSEAVIGPWSTIEDSEIGERTVVSSSQVVNAKIAADCTVGPFAHVRGGTVLERGAKVGSFVEVKNSHLGENTWASHLSYIGDAEFGARCNLGCGTATANFDRVSKHKTTVGDDVFVGCNSTIVAPLHVGDGAYIAAGSTVTEDVPQQALAISRARQANKKDWAAKHKKE